MLGITGSLPSNLPIGLFLLGFLALAQSLLVFDALY